MSITKDNTGNAFGAGTKCAAENYVSPRVGPGKRKVSIMIVNSIKRRFAHLLSKTPR